MNERVVRRKSSLKTLFATNDKESKDEKCAKTGDHESSSDCIPVLMMDEDVHDYQSSNIFYFYENYERNDEMQKLVEWCNPTSIHELSPEEKRMRLNYIRLRIRCAFHVIRFLHGIKKGVNKNFELSLFKYTNKFSIDEAIEQPSTQSSTFFEKLATGWLLIMTLSFYFTMYVTPALMLFPQKSEELFGSIVMVEFIWVLEMVRRLMFNAEAGQDPAEAAILYIRLEFFYDLFSTLPQIVSGFDPNYAVIKLLRAVHLSRLGHGLIEKTISFVY